MSWYRMARLVGAMLGMTMAVAPGVAADLEKSSISVMTYNVNGLPWPFASGRTKAFRRIETRLRAMRAAGAQPEVIVLQEAFTARAKQIAHNGGYRFVANGPLASLVNATPPSALDRLFSERASTFKGETAGKLLDSGLQIASDHPIISVKRLAFPAFACAGYDCLANKGVLLVTIQIPGYAIPVTVATTHLNSKRSSGVALSRSLYAYRRQVDSINAFLKAQQDARLPIIFVGDFNASNVERRAYLFGRGVPSWAALAARPVLSALDRCLNATPPCVGAVPPIAYFVRKRSRDWQFFRPGIRGSIEVERLSVLFGRELGGGMLSDHVGFGITYRLEERGDPNVFLPFLSHS